MLETSALRDEKCFRIQIFYICGTSSSFFVFLAQSVKIKADFFKMRKLWGGALQFQDLFNSINIVVLFIFYYSCDVTWEQLKK